MKMILACLIFATVACGQVMAQQAPCVPPSDTVPAIATRYGNPAQAPGAITVSRGVYVIPPMPVCVAACSGMGTPSDGQVCLPVTQRILIVRGVQRGPWQPVHYRPSVPASASETTPASGSSD